MEIIELILGVVRQSPGAFGVISALLLATVSFVAKHISDVRIRRYEARLQFVNSQLRDLYGPLYLLSEANNKSWLEFRRIFRPGRPMFDEDNPLTADEKSEYIRWLQTAFISCNEKIRKTIENNAHLFIEGRAPDIILTLLAHFDALNVVLSKLKDGADDNVFPSVAFPEEFSAYVKRDYDTVVRLHKSLLRHVLNANAAAPSHNR